MKKTRFTFLFLCISIMCFTFLTQANAQNQSNRNIDAQSYSVYTYVIIGSKETSEKSSVSNELSKTLEDVKREFGFTNFQVISAQFQNIKTDGKAAYRTILKGQKSDVGAERPIFAELALQKFYTPDLPNRESYGFGSFSFSARFPYVSEVLSANKELTEIVNYENVSTGSGNVEVMLNKPILISSLPVGDKSFFFVVKIKSNK